MKINVTGEHHYYKKGIHDVQPERAEYFVRVGLAEYVPEIVVSFKESDELAKRNQAFFSVEEKVIEQKTEKKIIEPVIEKKTIGRPPSKKDETDIEVRKTRKKRTTK